MGRDRRWTEPEEHREDSLLPGRRAADPPVDARRGRFEVTCVAKALQGRPVHADLDRLRRGDELVLGGQHGFDE